jgi:phosphomevalonate kinase
MDTQMVVVDKNKERDNVITARSPGKILACGGYVIISPNHQGLVFTSATFFECKIKSTGGMINYNNTGNIYIKVFSTNFNQTYNYAIQIDNKSIKILTLDDNDNSFIKFSILMAFYFHFNLNINEDDLNLLKNLCIEITLDSDYRFYSYKTGISKTGKVKTGLGSSSALVSSLTSSLLVFLNKNNSPTQGSIRNLNSISHIALLSAYYANNLAQNKV